MAADDSKADGTEKSKKKKMLLLAIIGLLVLVIAGGGFFAYKKFLAPHPAVTGEEGQAKMDKVEKGGEIFPLEPFVVNLADARGKRYLKIKIALELEESPTVKAKAEELVPKMQDMVIMVLTSLSFEDVMAPEGKIRIKEELLERFNQILRPDRVKNIYFTDFVIQ